MIIDLYSKRQKELRGETPDIYIYDTIPQSLRVQIVHIWRDALGTQRQYDNAYDKRHRRAQESYKFIVDVLCREYGLFSLTGNSAPRGIRNYLLELTKFLLEENEIEKVVDVIELSFRYVTYLGEQEGGNASKRAVEELNNRFREHGVGYEYHEGAIVRIDSQLLHAETVKPALLLLQASEYAGAQSEFLSAHEHYRHGRTKEAITDCLKSLESLIKTICTKRQWEYESNATAKTLIQILFDKGLIPAFWQLHFSALRSTLEAGVPTVRNKLSGHGQGSQVTEVPGHLTAYVLHLTASAMVFLASAENA